MKVLNIEEFVSEKLNIKPVTKDRLGKLKNEINEPRLNILSVNYNKVWDKQGTVYTQTIKVKMTESELRRVNNTLKNIAYTRSRFQKLGIPIEKQVYLQSAIPFEKGDNFLNLTTLDVLCDVYKLTENARVLRNKNTRLVIEL